MTRTGDRLAGMQTGLAHNSPTCGRPGGVVYGARELQRPRSVPSACASGPRRHYDRQQQNRRNTSNHGDV